MVFGFFGHLVIFFSHLVFYLFGPQDSVYGTSLWYSRFGTRDPAHRKVKMFDKAISKHVSQAISKRKK